MTTLGALKAALRTLDDDSATPIGHAEGEFLYRLLLDRRLTRTVEIGFAYGFSAAYILAATGSPHVAIDPQPELYGELGMTNLAALGLADHLQLERDVAHVVLPRLLAGGRRFDFAFVDGDHKFDTTFVEFYYLDLMMDVGGVVAFHDAWMPSIQHVASWIRGNKTNYRAVEAAPENLVVLQKTGADTRRWDHFADFAVPRPLMHDLRTRIRSRLSARHAK